MKSDHDDLRNTAWDQPTSNNKLKPKILLIGHARHGKDDFAKILVKLMGLSYRSSSDFVAKEVIWPLWGKERYDNYDEFFHDRMNNRSLWANLIEAYNTPDATKTVRTMFDRDNHDMYVGLRRRREYEACMEAKKFDHVIWIDACDRLPKEDTSSMELNHFDSDIFVDNNERVKPAPGQSLEEAVYKHLMPIALEVQKKLHEEGFNVNYETNEPKELDKMDKPNKGDRLDWKDAPLGSTKVLDHGFIRVEDVYGTDTKICEAARMSYGRGTKSVNADENLIRYLVTNYHTSPLEMASIKFHVRMPIFVARQWIRHRTAKLNEYSGRYSEMVELFYEPETEDIKTQHSTNKQGSGNSLDRAVASKCQDIIGSTSQYCFDQYRRLLDEKVSRETARIILPLNTYTEIVWNMDISNLLKFLYLRDDSHAQMEIRVYAAEIAKAVKEYFPAVYKAYLRVRNSVTLSQDQLKALMSGEIDDNLPKSEAVIVSDLWDTFGYEITHHTK